MPHHDRRPSVFSPTIRQATPVRITKGAVLVNSRKAPMRNGQAMKALEGDDSRREPLTPGIHATLLQAAQHPYYRAPGGDIEAAPHAHLLADAARRDPHHTDQLLTRWGTEQGVLGSVGRRMRRNIASPVKRSHFSVSTADPSDSENEKPLPPLSTGSNRSGRQLVNGVPDQHYRSRRAEREARRHWPGFRLLHDEKQSAPRRIAHNYI